ncbi:hypothetical protein GUITHDRAFT_144049 [Guillardia theta CCMP2712]|uniref:Ribosome biogenesis protein NOP53 n=1 Tax=Guillardia theta (strain CCMP2712) TaxID=905079 RepID=L1IRX2_GUITC|nr:hypothetical protein GUITHDRAFT_144049 [Guillardia theta CCMP2712]EKX38654.1 hypothetical protein GUITHDRAFT_144049 [Guillardia theta CCMP2712]|eukprot:XP_005825634.1 hypothetical protein GUITHDRAFT_144049 [Guillardia theta CCMP2712]
MGKRPAKSTKKSWQKLEQEGLEDALNAESNALLRNAEPQFKENDELFFVDKKGSALKVGRKDAWELKCNSILKPNEKIEARKVFRSGKKKNTIQERIDQFAEEIREHGSVVSRKRRSESAPQASERSFDLWGDAGESKNEDQWPKLYKNDPLKLENAVFDEHHVPNNKRRHMARMRPEPSKIKPVEVVSAGASYRPDGGQHEELMRKAAAVLCGGGGERSNSLREKIGLSQDSARHCQRGQDMDIVLVQEMLSDRKLNGLVGPLEFVQAYAIYGVVAARPLRCANHRFAGDRDVLHIYRKGVLSHSAVIQASHDVRSSSCSCNVKGLTVNPTRTHPGAGAVFGLRAPSELRSKMAGAAVPELQERSSLPSLLAYSNTRPALMLLLHTSSNEVEVRRLKGRCLQCSKTAIFGHPINGEKGETNQIHPRCNQHMPGGQRCMKSAIFGAPFDKGDGGDGSVFLTCDILQEWESKRLDRSWSMRKESKEGEQRVKRSLLTKKGTIVGPDDVGGPDESDLQGSVEDEEEEGRKEEDKASSKAAKEKGKLTRAERNKQARHKEVLRAQAAAKEEKKLLKQINRVGEIKKEVENILKIREQASSLEASLKDEKEAERIKRLGKIKLQKEAPEVLLPEEIPTKLRAVKPVGNTLRDKFKNLQKRNLIEPRRSQAGKRKDKTLSVLKAHKIKARAFIDF